VIQELRSVEFGDETRVGGPEFIVEGIRRCESAGEVEFPTEVTLPFSFVPAGRHGSFSRKLLTLEVPTNKKGRVKSGSAFAL
jgi:hypothetical protein